ncbi:MAG TPA: hypothetical protein VFH61_06725 [Thermoleophilia bacterium]|nr:hypothetical protein [Thermoleophilia bacterium]
MSQTSTKTVGTTVAANETEVRCGRCTSFIFALIGLVKPQRVRGYCKRCGHRWTQTVQPKATE